MARSLKTMPTSGVSVCNTGASSRTSMDSLTAPNCIWASIRITWATFSVTDSRISVLNPAPRNVELVHSDGKIRHRVLAGFVGQRFVRSVRLCVRDLDFYAGCDGSGWITNVTGERCTVLLREDHRNCDQGNENQPRPKHSDQVRPVLTQEELGRAARFAGNAWNTWSLQDKASMTGCTARKTRKQENTSLE